MNEKNNEKKRLAYLAKRIELMGWLGGVCQKCGEPDFRVLQFAHVKPVKRSLTGVKKADSSGSQLLRVIEKLGKRKARKAFQLLCANDHLRDTWDNGGWSWGRTHA